ncbi:hypothetical protein BJ742DRAFT_779853 [Cladochytrium replicatum]|nr:hypothetical protein BJ742DRAFT_779853 [Cladochytrium replicatum]
MIYRQVVFKLKAIAKELLITSMLLSGLINSVNTSASGIIFLTTGSLPPQGSAGCTGTGFIRQWSLQAMDFTMLVTTLLTCSPRTNGIGIMEAFSKLIWHTLASIWGISLATAIAAQLLVGYGSAGPWCTTASGPYLWHYMCVSDSAMAPVLQLSV